MPRDKIPTEEMIDELQRLAEELGKSPTTQEMNDSGEYSHQTYLNRFGSWNEALREAGLETGPYRHPDDKLLDELQRLAEELGKPPKTQDMDDSGEYSHGTYVNRFGSWNEALREVGLETRPYRGTISDDELLDELQRLADELNRPPTADDVLEHGEHSPSTYRNRYDSWNGALRAAGVGPKTAPGADHEAVETGPSITAERIVVSVNGEKRTLSTDTTLAIADVEYRIDGFEPAVGDRGRFGWIAELRLLGEVHPGVLRFGTGRERHIWLDDIAEWLGEGNATET